MSMQDTGRTRTECVLLGGAPNTANSAFRAKKSCWFTTDDRTTIASFYDGEWPRATAFLGQARLPQARSRWIVGARLPAYAHTSALPQELEDRLTALEPGYQRLIVGSEILCVEAESHKIVDVMRDTAFHNATAPTAHLLLDGAATQAAAG